MEYNAISGKLVILFVMEKMEIPLTEKSIVDICAVRNHWINYMDCIDLIYQLSEEKLIYKLISSSNEQRFNLTVEGRECLSLFYARVPFSLREEISEYTKNNRVQIKTSQEYECDYRKNTDGSYTVSLKIFEPMMPESMFSMEIKAPSRQAAEEACLRWKKEAPTVYEYIFDLLINPD